MSAKPKGKKNNGPGKTGPPPQRKKKVQLVVEPLRNQRAMKAPKTIVAVHKKQMQLTIGVPTNVGAKMSVPVIAEFDSTQFSATFASFYSYLATKNLFADQDVAANDATVNAISVLYMFNNMLPMISSTDQKLTSAPIVAWDIVAALKSKSCNFLSYGKIVYSWGNLPSTVATSIYTSGGTWEPTYVTSDLATYNSPCTILTAPGTASDYNFFLQKLSDIGNNSRLKVVDSTYKSILVNDVSTFARSYVYNGDYISPTGGFYKDIESEVQITAPCLSSYGVYGISDLRAPLKLTPFSGDGATAFGYPLHPSFGSYFNKRPPSYKLIDFEWIYFTLCQYMVTLVQKYVANSGGPPRIGPLFAFTQQDFRIALRQALMCVFDTNYFTQFITTLRFNSGDNGFAPFQVSGGTCPSNMFTTFLVPKLIQENLAALRARSYRNPQAKGHNESAFIPVLGRYTEDIPAIFNYIGSDNNPYPLFSIAPQNPISLINGFSSPTTYVNLNGSFYQAVKSDWNNMVQEFSTVSVAVSSICGDGGPPGLGILFYTAVQRKIETTFTNTTIVTPPRMVRAVRSVVNASRSFEKTDKGVMAIPPASIVSLSTIQTTTNFNYSAQVAALYDSLITPQVRLDINSPEDQLSLQMYQCEVKEPISTAWANVAAGTGAGLASRLTKLAEMCVPGIARDESSEYSQIIELLSLHNQAGMLSSILGGFAKSILPPDLHGVVDIVSDLVPF